MCLCVCVCLRVCMCESFQSASVNVPWVLTVIMSVSWCLAEKAALKGVFRHLSLVITLNYYHSLNCGSPAHAYVCSCEPFRSVRSPVEKDKAPGQISELNTSHPPPVWCCSVLRSRILISKEVCQFLGVQNDQWIAPEGGWHLHSLTN